MPDWPETIQNVFLVFYRSKHTYRPVRVRVVSRAFYKMLKFSAAIEWHGWDPRKMLCEWAKLPIRKFLQVVGLNYNWGGRKKELWDLPILETTT